jgi:AAA+ superfamily predicted ATPase
MHFLLAGFLHAPVQAIQHVLEAVVASRGRGGIVVVGCTTDVCLVAGRTRNRFEDVIAIKNPSPGQRQRIADVVLSSQSQSSTFTEAGETNAASYNIVRLF